MNNILLLCVLCAIASVSMVLAICITISVLTIAKDIFNVIIGELLAEIEAVDEAEADEERQRIRITYTEREKIGK